MTLSYCNITALWCSVVRIYTLAELVNIHCTHWLHKLVERSQSLCNWGKPRKQLLSKCCQCHGWEMVYWSECMDIATMLLIKDCIKYMKERPCRRICNWICCHHGAWLGLNSILRVWHTYSTMYPMILCHMIPHQCCGIRVQNLGCIWSLLSSFSLWIYNPPKCSSLCLQFANAGLTA